MTDKNLTSGFTHLTIEIWENLNTGEIEVHTTKNNYGACLEWCLVARRMISYMNNDGLLFLERNVK